MSQDLKPAAHGLKRYYPRLKGHNGIGYSVEMVEAKTDTDWPLYVLASEVDAQRAPVAGGLTEAEKDALERAEAWKAERVGLGVFYTHNGATHTLEILAALVRRSPSGSLQVEAGEAPIQSAIEMQAVAALHEQVECMPKGYDWMTIKVRNDHARAIDGLLAAQREGKV